MLTAELVLNPRCELGEGPLWDEREQCLYWVDIKPGKIHRYDPKTGEHALYSVGQKIGTVGLRENGGLIVAVESGFAYYDPAVQTLTAIVDPESHNTNKRFNDGKPSPDGGFFAGSMGLSAEEGAGTLYYLSPEGEVKTIFENATISNGIAWSMDRKTMYYIDTPPRKVYAFDYDETNGAVSNMRLAFEVAEEYGHPDGMTIDTEGMLWIAHYGGGAVRRWDPETGEVLETINVPTPNTTCPTFGGENFDVLYITTAWQNMSEADKEANPLAGGIFAIQLPYKGLPAFRYQG